MNETEIFELEDTSPKKIKKYLFSVGNREYGDIHTYIFIHIYTHILSLVAILHPLQNCVMFLRTLDGNPPSIAKLCETP